MNSTWWASFMVFLGGGSGAFVRFTLFKFFPLPWTTLLINLLGSFLIGYGYSSLQNRASYWLTILFIPGFLGGFTTFSAFSLESLRMIQERHYFMLLGYIFLSVAGGVIGAWLGTRLAA